MMSGVIQSAPINAFEQARLDRIAENNRRMAECGLLDAAVDLMKVMKAPISKPRPRRTPKGRRPKTRFQPIRRSTRLTGEATEFCELKDDKSGSVGVTYALSYDEEPGLDDLLADGGEIEALPKERQEQFQEMRCSSAGRGSMYDSVAGITCHFCRQKKLCGEEGCPRCSRRSTTAECIGKTDCSRCHSATGRFCRACLEIRYGQQLEDVRAGMAAGAWLCPHCYEDDHPGEGWMCNSSICMKRRGYKPTGIAIYDAQQRGFPSVAHWLQAQLKRRGEAVGTSAAAGGAGEVEAQEGQEDAATELEPIQEEEEEGPAEEMEEEGAAADAAPPARKTRSGAKKAAEAAAAPAASNKKAAAAAAADKKAAAAGANNSKKAAKAGASNSNKKAGGGGDDAGARQRDQEEERDQAAGPPTPLKLTEPITPGAAKAAAAAGGRRTTRAAAAASGVEAAELQSGGGGNKRACVGHDGAAGSRRSLRFRA